MLEKLNRWLTRRRVEALKQRVARMKKEAKEAELEPLMPVMETITRRIRLERLVVLERAVKDIERREALTAAASAQSMPAEQASGGRHSFVPAQIARPS
jgi:hypothetical protein